MAHERDLLRAIRNDPDNDELRYLFADWCDENGRPERAEFIRLQMRRATVQISGPDLEELIEREEELRQDHGEGWLNGWSEENTAVDFNRGFPELLICYGKYGADYLLQHGAELFALAPITHLWLSPQGGIAHTDFPWELGGEKAVIDRLRRTQFLHILDLPFLSYLRSLDLGPTDFGEEGKLQGTSIGNLLGDEAIIALAQTATLANLRELLLSQNNVGDAGARAVVASPHLRKLQELHLDTSRLTKDGQSLLRAHFGSAVSFDP